MRVLSISLFLAATSLPVAADVMPHCGGPKVEIRDPGQDCGHHGPRWRGDCRAPAACFIVEQHGATCTKTCTTDADCAPLGAGFTCTGQGSPYASSEITKTAICISRAQREAAP